MSIEWVRNIFCVRNLGRFLLLDVVFISGKLSEIGENDFGTKANIITVLIWSGIENWRKICLSVTKDNNRSKKKQVVMYAHLNGNEKLGKLLKYLTDILLESNKPISM